MSETLQVVEIYRTLQGESSRAGLPCVMIRLGGCNLRCAWCDTPEAQSPEAGEPMTADAILAHIAPINCPRVEVTGGEPMLQPDCGTLLGALIEAGYETLLETNGTVDLSTVPAETRRIVDVKCPSSGQADQTHWANLELLDASDEVKFVIAEKADYEFTRNVIGRHQLADRCGVILSPVTGRLQPAVLADWILVDRLDVRLGLQLHKIIWPEKSSGV